MKTVSVATQNLLDNFDTCIFADFYTITLAISANGQPIIIRKNNSSLDMMLHGELYTSDWNISRTTFENTIGLSIDEITITIETNEDTIYTDIWSNVSTIQALASTPFFDKAKIRIERVFMASWGDTSAGAVPICPDITIETITSSSYKVIFTCKTAAVGLDIQLPMYDYSTTCSNTFCDHNCNPNGILDINPSYGGHTWAFAIACQEIIDQTHISCPSYLGATDEDFFANGYAIRLTGCPANYVNEMTMIAGNTPGVNLHDINLILATPFAHPITATDVLIIVAGCDKTVPMCDGRFNNLVNYGGQLYIPPVTPVG